MPGSGPRPSPAPPAHSGREAPDLDRIAGWLRPLASPVRLRLLRFLTRPHYQEEIAAALGLSRQATRKHLDKLVRIGVLERRSGVRGAGPVTEYVINPQALFLIHDEFEKLGSFRPDGRDDALARTLPGSGSGRPAAAKAAPGPCLFVVRGFGTGTRLDLGPEEGRVWLVGRDPRCEIALTHDPYASNRQAELVQDGGRFVLTDLRSTNGTEHNWAPLARGARVTLRHGDIIGIGRTLLLFWDAPA